tara:strand:- start:147 stop:593 length:447 start_codon:yes stop_codon:yes gene_type:complete
MEYNLESIQLNLKIKYLNNIINGCNKSDIDTSNVKKLLQSLSNQELESYSVTEKIIETEKVSETQHVDYLYLKPWNKLTLIHKIIKIKEFTNNLDIKDTSEKEELKDKLIELLKSKSIKNKINYDETKGKVISISQLSFDNGKYLIIS